MFKEIQLNIKSIFLFLIWRSLYIHRCFVYSLFSTPSVSSSNTSNNCLRTPNFSKCWFLFKKLANPVNSKIQEERTTSDEFLIFLHDKGMSAIQSNSLKWYYKKEYEGSLFNNYSLLMCERTFVWAFFD